MWSRRNASPVLFLSIDGEPADDLLRLCTRFEYKQQISKASEAKFTFRNDDRKLLDDPRLFPNVVWRFRFGFLNDLSPIIPVQVREIAPTYAEKRTVQVTLYDAAINLAEKSSARNWGRISSSEVAKRIAAEHGLTAKVDDSGDTPKKAWIQPQEVNDLQYLRDLAGDIDYEVFVDGDPPVLYYRRKPYDRAPAKTLVYYDDPTETSYVKKFQPKVKGLGPTKTGTASSDGGAGKGTSAATKDGDRSAPALAPRKVAVVAATRALTSRPAETGPGSTVTKAAASGADVQGLAHAARQQMLDKANEATSEHPLTPSLVAGKLYVWAGIEKQVNGKWDAKEANHQISGTGSSTTVTWKRNAKGAGDDPSKKQNNKGEEGGGKPGTVRIGRDRQPVYTPPDNGHQR